MGGAPRYRRIRRFAEGHLARALRPANRQGLPLYLILDADIAMNLGAMLHDEFMSAVMSWSSTVCALWDFDSVDIGKLRQPSMTVPVTIKSLIFNDVADGVHRRELVHHPDGQRQTPN